MSVCPCIVKNKGWLEVPLGIILDMQVPIVVLFISWQIALLIYQLRRSRPMVLLRGMFLTNLLL